MDIDIEIDHIYESIAKDVETRFNASCYELDHCLNKKIKK